MKTRIKNMWLHVLVLLFAVSVAHAQAPQPAQPAPIIYSQAELEQMLAPVALYPDGLLSQLLMASTFPYEVYEAANWSAQNPGYQGDAAVQAVQLMTWDISVKSLMPFPRVLETMASQPEWTESLGNAFINQQTQVMDTIQLLRNRAMKAGHLKTDTNTRVVVKEQAVYVYPVEPTRVYVPYYNPTVVYGAWPYAAYQPVYWDPWPGYAVGPAGWGYSPVAAIVGVGLLYGAFSWHNHNVYHHHNHNYYSGHHNYNHYRSTTTWSRDRHDTRKPLPPSNTRVGTHTKVTKTAPPTPGTRGPKSAGVTQHGLKPKPGVKPTTTTGKPGTKPGTTGTKPGTKSGATGTKPGTKSGTTGTKPGTKSGTTKPTTKSTGSSKPGTGPGPSGGKSHAKPQGQAKGVHGTQPGKTGTSGQKKPAGQKPASQKPASQKPAGQKPASQKPAGQKPAGQKPQSPPKQKPATSPQKKHD